MSKSRAIIILLSITLFSSQQTTAQDMNSPYSVYGIGDIDMQRFSMNGGMGYSGKGLKSNFFTPGNNPASASGLPRSLLIMNADVTGRLSNYKGDAINNGNSSSQDFTIKGLSLSEKITKFWASGIGLRQYSVVNYQFTKSQYADGTNTKYLSYFTGNGGLKEYYWNNAFNIGKHFSAGVTTSFISGPITQTETLTNGSDLTIESTRKDYYGNYRFEYGILYQTDPAKHWVISAGLSYAPQSKLNYERSLQVAINGVSVTDEFIRYNKFSLPQTFGGGIAISNKKGKTFLLDYDHYNWGAFNYKGSGYRLTDAQRISIGFESAKLPEGNKNVLPRSFQAGAYFSNSYLQLNNQAIQEMGITAGIKRSIKNRLLIGASLEGGFRGTTNGGLIREGFIQAVISISLRDYIFSSKQKYN